MVRLMVIYEFMKIIYLSEIIGRLLRLVKLSELRVRVTIGI